MTVIAWDGQTLAADRACNIGGILFECTKVRRLGDALVALAGDGPRLEQLVAWLVAGGEPEKYPSRSENNESVLVVIDRLNGVVRVRRFEATGFPIEFHGQYYADGSGRDVALAAMHCGKSAEEAVLLASKLTAWCGHGFDALHIDGGHRSSV